MAVPPPQRPLYVAPPNFSPMEKVLTLTPAIAAFERLAKEFQQVQDGTHPELDRVEREQKEEYRRKCEQLQKNSDYWKKLREKEYECEIQSAQDELEDFKMSNGYA